MYGLPAYGITLGGARWKEFHRAFPTVARFDGVAAPHGCTLSHLRLMRQALAQGHPAVAVFEDDARVARAAGAADRAAIAAFLADRASEVLLLGFSPRVHSWDATGTPHLAVGHALDAHAYLVTARGMRKILAAFPADEECVQPAYGLGANDTYFLAHQVNAIVPPLYRQIRNERYEPHVRPNVPLYLASRAGNLAWFYLYGWEPWRLGVVLLCLAVAGLAVARTRKLLRKRA